MNSNFKIFTDYSYFYSTLSWFSPSPKNWPFSLGVISYFIKKHVLVNNRRTVTAGIFFFFRKYRYFNSLSNATLRFKYLDSIIKRKRETILRKSNIRNKTKTYRPDKKTKENETCVVKIKRVEAEIQAYTHTHAHMHTHTYTFTHTPTHTYTHTHIHTHTHTHTHTHPHTPPCRVASLTSDASPGGG